MKQGDLTFVAMMLGTAQAQLNLALHDVTKGHGRWRMRAFAQIDKSRDSVEMARKELIRVTRRKPR